MPKPPMTCHDLQSSVYVKLEYCAADAASGCAACPHARARTHASRFLPSYVVRFSYRRHQHLTCASQSHSNDRAPPKILHRRASRGHLWSRHHVHPSVMCIGRSVQGVGRSWIILLVQPGLLMSSSSPEDAMACFPP